LLLDLPVFIIQFLRDRRVLGNSTLQRLELLLMLLHVSLQLSVLLLVREHQMLDLISTVLLLVLESSNLLLQLRYFIDVSL
jgi:hypothetical protein